jgi:acyltransferase
MNRIAWIDYAKFLGIFLVALGHTKLPVSLINFIYSFHMPLFFFISGFLFNPEKYATLRQFAARRARQLLIPYLIAAAITYVFWVFVGRKFGVDATLDIPLLTPLIGTFYGTDSGYNLVHCGSLWFLPCLFLTELIYFTVARTSRYWLLLALLFVGYVNYRLHHFMLPFSFDVALVALYFYAAGHLLKKPVSAIAGLSPVVKGLVALVSCLMVIYLANVNGRSDMSSNSYHNFFLFLVGAFTGILMTVCTSTILGNMVGPLRLVTFFAAGTILVLAFHEITASIVKGVAHFLLKVDLGVFEGGIISNLLLTVASFTLLAPLIFLTEKYLPAAMGRRKAESPGHA